MAQCRDVFRILPKIDVFFVEAISLYLSSQKGSMIDVRQRP